MAGLSKAGEEAQAKLYKMRQMIMAAQEASGLKRGTALLERPEFGLTAGEYAEIERIPQSTANIHLSKMLKNGSVTECLVMLPTSSNKIMAQRVFVFKEPVSGSGRQKGQDRRNARVNRSGRMV